MMSTSQYKKSIRQLTKSMNSRGPSEISDFQSTFCLEKVDFPCMKNGQVTFWCVQKHSRLVRRSQEMLLHTHKVSIWCLQVSIRSPSVTLQNQWIQVDRQKFLTFSQLFVLKKWIFLAWKMVRNCSDVSKNTPDLFVEVRRCFYIPTKLLYEQ